MPEKNEKLLSYEEVLKIIKNTPNVSEGEKSTQLETVKYKVLSLLDKRHAPVALKKDLINLGLTEFEAIQILNTPPKKILDLYVIVEELEERLTEEKIEKVLKLMEPYTE
ncbi:DNA-directed RNA polymerase III subunit RPC9 [Nematocida sp. AWRm80]|nr:DNA-directed RNA polymerase III subunit RPC9 [Nematocida sp. AWRm80]